LHDWQINYALLGYDVIFDFFCLQAEEKKRDFNQDKSSPDFFSSETNFFVKYSVYKIFIQERLATVIPAIPAIPATKIAKIATIAIANPKVVQVENKEVSATNQAARK